MFLDMRVWGDKRMWGALAIATALGLGRTYLVNSALAPAQEEMMRRQGISYSAPGPVERPKQPVSRQAEGVYQLSQHRSAASGISVAMVAAGGFGLFVLGAGAVGVWVLLKGEANPPDVLPEQEEESLP